MRGILLALLVGVFPVLVAAESRPEPGIEAAATADEIEVTEALTVAPNAGKAAAEDATLEVVATSHGKASFYAKRFHGRRTASGEPHDAQALTAAHRSLPYGTWVRVQSLQSGLEVKVRINDRGPFIRGRVIDLSRAAAEALGMIQAGTHAVKLQVLGLPQR
jgi:rare lipoprotein A